MANKLDNVMAEAMALTLEDRAQLVGRLLLSLDEPSDSEIERLWLEEAARRLKEFREGTVQGIPADEVFRRVLADLS
ncbi:MAG: addiction module protein [Candidatus Hydrogenedentes bacterium]|nr:addiction module protein [Candidatus Hydrogenedentota bacterium]